VFEDPADAIFNAVLAVSVMGLVIGAVYVGGGVGAVRREAPLLVLFACGLLVIVFVVPLVERAIGFTFALALVALSGILLVARILMRRGESPAAAEHRREVLSRPAVRALFVAWFAFIIIATVLLLIITNPSGT
jgi:hypothetical protein